MTGGGDGPAPITPTAPEPGETGAFARSLLEHSCDAVVLLDAEARVTYASPSFESLTGLMPHEVLGGRGTDFVHPDDRATIDELFARLRGTTHGPVPVLFRLARSDSTYLDVEAVTMSITDDASAHGTVLTIRDVSLRRRVDEMIRSGERQAQAVLDSLQVGVVVYSPEATIEACNVTAAALLGRSAEQLLGSDDSRLGAAFAESGVRVVDELGNEIPPEQFPASVTLRTGEEMRDVIHAHVYPDGQTKFLRCSTKILAGGAASHVGGVVVGFEDVTERRVTFLAEKAERLQGRRVLDALRDGVLMFGSDGRVLTSNSAVEGLFGIAPEWVEGRTYEELMRLLETSGGSISSEDDSPFAIETHPAVLSRETGEIISNVIMRIKVSAAGDPRWFQVTARPLTGLSAEPPFPVVVSLADITASKQAEIERLGLLELIARERRFLAEVLDTVDEGIIACDANGVVTVCNDKMRLFLHLGAEDDPSGAPASVDGLVHADGSPLRPGEHPLMLALAGSRVSNVELVVEPAGGIRRIVLANGHSLFSADGSLLGAVVTFHDVTAQRRLESELSDLALHDPLTGAANRILLSDRLGVAFERSAREGAAVGVMLIDLDDFKLVNDTLGHAAGDEVLVNCAERLHAVVRAGDTVARLGGDEFVIVCPMIRSEQELSTVRDRLAAALAEPQHVAGRDLVITGSLGFALELPARATPDALLRAADESMYRAKDERRLQRGAARGAPLAAGREA